MELKQRQRPVTRLVKISLSRKHSKTRWWWWWWWYKTELAMIMKMTKRYGEGLKFHNMHLVEHVNFFVLNKK